MNGVIEIIEEHSRWLTVGKPSGLSVHNAEDGYNLLSILEEQLGYKLYAAHRLDQPTSGIILLGRVLEVPKCYKRHSQWLPKNIRLSYVVL